MKRATWAAVAVISSALGLWAHHSYPMFYQLDQILMLKGQVSSVVFTPPHVMLTVETRNSGTWKAEWTAPSTLQQQRVGPDTVRVGDILEIDGSPAKDPTSRVVSALLEMRRPSDGWRWTRAGIGSRPANSPRTIE